MGLMNVNVKITKNNVSKFLGDTKGNVQKGVRTIAQDLARTSSESAPHKTGNLEKSFKITYHFGGTKYYAEVRYSAIENGFDYAIAMHEWNYKLGEGSRRKRGGTGMSGRTYPVGRKFLTGVLEGESQAYRDYIRDILKANVK